MRAQLRTKSRQNIKKIIAILVLLAFMVILNFTGFYNNIKNFFFSISAPVQNLFWQGGKNSSNFLSLIFEAEDLKKEINDLYSENQGLIFQIVSLEELKKENEFLRQALGLGLEKEFELMPVRIISKDVFQDSILINKGKRDGVLSGLPVVTEQKVLVGRIGEVYDNFSEVILISNEKSSFDVEISSLFIKQEEEKEKIYGMAKGKGSFSIEIELIPKNEEISKEKIVITSVLGGVYPQSLLVGEIKEIKKSDTDLFQTAKVDPFFNIKNLDYLFIIQNF